MPTNECPFFDPCNSLDYDSLLSLKSKRLGIMIARNRSKMRDEELDDQINYLDYRIESLTNCLDEIDDPWKLNFEPNYFD